MTVAFTRTAKLTGAEAHYCPGCTHGIVHRLVAEALEGLDLLGTTIGSSAVGCSSLFHRYLNAEMVECLHGRTQAVAIGIKRVR